MARSGARSSGTPFAINGSLATEPGRETDITTNITGTVNLPGYLEWLHCHRYGLNLLQIQ